MAHPRVIAQRQAIAYQRLVDAAGKLRDRFGVGEQVDALVGIAGRDPAYKQMQQSEALAELLEALGKDDPKPTGEPVEPPVTIETVEEKPLETIETVEVVKADEVKPTAPKRGSRHEN